LPITNATRLSACAAPAHAIAQKTAPATAKKAKDLRIVRLAMIGRLTLTRRCHEDVI
jgi:hypothetical protein